MTFSLFQDTCEWFQMQKNMGEIVMFPQSSHWFLVKYELGNVWEEYMLEQLVEIKVFYLWFDLHRMFWTRLKGDLQGIPTFSYHQQR